MCWEIDNGFEERGSNTERTPGRKKGLCFDIIFK
jgi:hypothetical protein